MKNILSIGIIALVLANMSLASAEVGGTVTRIISAPVYTSAEDFLKAEGTTCQLATDGCNTIQIDNGVFGAATEIYCMDTPTIYSCTQYIEQPTMCTMQYEPVCGINGVTYGNSCMAQGAEIAYAGECSAMVDSDLLTKLNSNTVYVAKVETILESVETSRLETAVTTANKLIENTKLLKIVQELQVERITLLTFLKNIINSELMSR